MHLEKGISLHRFSQTECFDFIQRCIRDIEHQPDSLQAGLSSVLLQTISVTSTQLQDLVINAVFLKMLCELQGDIPEMRHVAYLTVLTSLVTKTSESPLYEALHQVTLQDEQTARMLEQLIARNLELD